MKTSVIITAAGLGSRCNLPYNKVLFDIGGMTILEKTISMFYRKDISSIYITSSKEDYVTISNLFKNAPVDVFVLLGGKTRQESVFKALSEIKDADVVIIHDAARPFVSSLIIDNALSVAFKKGNCTVATKMIDSIRKTTGSSSKAVDRNLYARVQTPQIFNFKTILNCHKKAAEDNLAFLDDASLFEYYGNEVFLSEGSESNKKITTQEDLLAFAPKNSFVGHGFDTHELVDGRKLILGGIEIPHTKGLLGHSDADVLTHAIMDALLSASHNKDIGQLFPDTSMQFKDICSLILLQKVAKILLENEYIIGNISAVIMAQKPKLASFIPLMQKQIASTLGIQETQVTISATTTEKLGLCGHEEAISASAYCLLYKR